MLTITPRRLSEPIVRLARELVPGGTPEYVEVAPVAGGAVNECFANVDRAVATRGGARVLGWALWEWPTVMIEAELHAVWRPPGAGPLIDVSPRADAEARILFLPDPDVRYTGRQVNNRRRVLRDDPAVREFIRVADQIHAVMNAGERADQFGLVSVPRDEIVPLVRRHAELRDALARRRPGPNEPCACGSGRKAKRCCAARAR